MRPSYWEWRAELEASRTRWMLATAGLVIVSLALSGLLVAAGTRPRPIYYITETHGTAWPGQIPDAMLDAFATRVVTLLGTLSPGTAKQSYDLAGRYLTPPLRSRLLPQAQRDLDAIMRQQLGTALAVTVTTVERRPRGGWTVTLRGTRQSWSQTQYLGEDRLRYVLQIDPVPPTELNPWGLIVHDLSLERDGGPAPARASSLEAIPGSTGG